MLGILTLDSMRTYSSREVAIRGSFRFFTPTLASFFSPGGRPLAEATASMPLAKLSIMTTTRVKQLTWFYPNGTKSI